MPRITSRWLPTSPPERLPCTPVVPAQAWLCAANEARVSFWWLFFSTVLVTVGELYLSPVGLSVVTKISPVRTVSTMMGVWFFSSFLGNYAAGFLGHC